VLMAEGLTVQADLELTPTNTFMSDKIGSQPVLSVDRKTTGEATDSTPPVLRKCRATVSRRVP